MRFIKLGLISIVFFSLLLTGMSLLLPSSINISRVTDIHAPADSVYKLVNDLSNWQKWYAGYDSSKPIFSKNTIGKGASATLNNTTVTIRKTSLQAIEADWQTGSGDPLPGEFYISTKGASSPTTLQWLFVQKVKWYPWQKFALLVSDRSIGPFMEESLDNLKKVAEQQ